MKDKFFKRCCCCNCGWGNQRENEDEIIKRVEKVVELLIKDKSLNFRDVWEKFGLNNNRFAFEVFWILARKYEKQLKEKDAKVDNIKVEYTEKDRMEILGSEDNEEEIKGTIKIKKGLDVQVDDIFICYRDKIVDPYKMCAKKKDAKKVDDAFKTVMDLYNKYHETYEKNLSVLSCFDYKEPYWNRPLMKEKYNFSDKYIKKIKEAVKIIENFEASCAQQIENFYM